ncbi:hypothetical protein BDP55DRAFT_439259 [Colletotrichum godetiae]|uniref:Uncharacterized protein n=1 Tax=Colletotrichum godetiae TaxID=1209918 RepID=A0AAJ0A6I6_9PEZI|nr:uncharacterized protein BDP55DRAFT_439259 [Colletotrichum godetiae]KAK1657380.1 hypothetical protein BDP55DRAFT_439259 [Colletotrichum godetiae]
MPTDGVSGTFSSTRYFLQWIAAPHPPQGLREGFIDIRCHLLADKRRQSALFSLLQLGLRRSRMEEQGHNVAKVLVAAAGMIYHGVRWMARDGTKGKRDQNKRKKTTTPLPAVLFSGTSSHPSKRRYFVFRPPPPSRPCVPLQKKTLAGRCGNPTLEPKRWRKLRILLSHITNELVQSSSLSPFCFNSALFLSKSALSSRWPMSLTHPGAHMNEPLASHTRATP